MFLFFFSNLRLKGRTIIFLEGGGVMRNLQAQTIFFQLQAHKQFFSGNGFANNFFSTKCIALLWGVLCYYISVTTYWIISVVLFFMLPYLSAVVPEFFCCLHISAFNLSSTCLLASLITSSLSPPSTLSIVLLLSTGVTLTLASLQAMLSRESSGFPQHSSSLLSWVLAQKSLFFLHRSAR